MTTKTKILIGGLIILFLVLLLACFVIILSLTGGFVLGNGVVVDFSPGTTFRQAEQVIRSYHLQINFLGHMEQSVTHGWIETSDVNTAKLIAANLRERSDITKVEVEEIGWFERLPEEAPSSKRFRVDVSFVDGLGVKDAEEILRSFETRTGLVTENIIAIRVFPGDKKAKIYGKLMPFGSEFIWCRVLSGNKNVTGCAPPILE